VSLDAPDVALEILIDIFDGWLLRSFVAFVH